MHKLRQFLIFSSKICIDHVHHPRDSLHKGLEVRYCLQIPCLNDPLCGKKLAWSHDGLLLNFVIKEGEIFLWTSQMR